MSNPTMDPAFEAVLRPRLPYLTDDAELSPDAPLRELGLDSMQAVELVFDLEDALDVQLPDEAMTAETFATAASLWVALTAARDEAGVGAS
jgi:acyl carrier protein